MNNKDTVERAGIRLANILSILMLVFYVILRYVDLVLTDTVYRFWPLMSIAFFTALLMAMSLVFAKSSHHLSILMPSSLTVGLFLSMYYSEGLPYIFVAFVGLCLLCGAYFNLKNFVRFVLGLNLAIFVSMILLPYGITGPEVSSYASYVMWGLMQLCIIVTYITVRHTIQRHANSINSMNSYDAILTTTPNLVALVDGHNCVRHISNCLAELANVQRLDMVLGRPILDLFNNNDMVEMITDALDAEADYKNTAQVKFGDKIVHYKITSTLITIDEKHGKFIDISDVTPIMNAKFEAESASRAKSDFLSKMSHEIRTPMNGIIGMTEVLFYEDIPDTTRTQVETIKHSGNHLLSIINNILDFSKIESGMLEVSPKSYLLHSLINDVISIITMQMKDLDLQMTVYVDRNIPQELFGDVVRIRQILLNIISNSVKYTKTGYVSLEVLGAVTGSGSIEIAFKVTDTGIGIKQEDMNRLFDKFSQFDLERNQGIEGTGLGLAITHSLVKIMSGWIDVKSIYGEGTVFTVTLPQEFKKMGMMFSVSEPDKKRVLLYGLTELYTESIVRTLKDLGIRYYITESEVELYFKLHEKSWNFVFTEPSLADSVEDMADRLEVSPNIVVTVNSWDVGQKNGFTTLIMPTYFVAVTNVLNNTKNYSENGAKAVEHFIAPDAKVLVVDDIDTNLKVAQGLLDIYGIQTDVCSNGMEAVESVQKKDYDLVLMDYMMPGMDGITAMETIREMQGARYKNMNIVVLTANAIVGTREMFMQKGFDEFLPKPMELTKLHNILEIFIPKEKQMPKNQKSDKVKRDDFEGNSINIEGVDIKRGLALTRGSVKGYLDILAVFYRDGMTKINELKDSLANGDLEIYTIHIHALKAALANIGSISLSKTAQDLENAGNKIDVDYINDNNFKFLSELEVLLDSIHDVLQTQSEILKSHDYEEDEVILDCLTKLKSALETFDHQAIDKAARILGGFSIEPGGRIGEGAVKDILENVLIGEYELAALEIERIQGQSIGNL